VLAVVAVGLAIWLVVLRGRRKKKEEGAKQASV
jgi:hypothetical protein